MIIMIEINKWPPDTLEGVSGLETGLQRCHSVWIIKLRKKSCDLFKINLKSENKLFPLLIALQIGTKVLID